MLKGEGYTMLAAVFAAYHMHARPRLWQRSQGKGAYTALAEAGSGDTCTQLPARVFPLPSPFRSHLEGSEM